MPTRSGAPLDALDDEAQDWTAEALRELARSHVAGRLSYEGWRAAVWDIIEAAARRRDNGKP